MSNVEIRFPDAPEIDLSVHHFDIVEAISRPFEVELVTYSAESDVDLERPIGRAARVEIRRGPLGSRVFSGVCAAITQREGVERGGATTGIIMYRYDVRVVPSLWLLSHRRNNRSFQHASAPDIADKILGEYGIQAERRFTGKFPALEYRVQWGESDLAFVSRLLEDAGISYFFDDDGRLVLSDRPEGDEPHGELAYMGRPPENTEKPYATHVRVGRTVGPGKAVVADFDLRRPRYALEFRAADPGNGETKLERYEYAPGASLVDLASDASADQSTPTADDQSHARHDAEAGVELARGRLGGDRAGLRQASFETNRVDLAPGKTIRIDGAPRVDLGVRLTIIGARMEGKVEDAWTIRPIAAAGVVRPRTATPRPRIEGLQSALVMGPAGEEIHVDEIGRVRVRFHWDREGGKDDTRSPWVRVDEAWSGGAFGVITPPRVGDEVLVAYYDGNPDQPVIVGRAHNAAAPDPNPLPGSQTRTTWRTRSTPDSGGYHELTFDDQKGRELVYVRSERDLATEVRREERESAGLDRVVIVGRHQATTIDQEDAITAGYKHEVTMSRMGDMHIAEAGEPDSVPTSTRREVMDKRITISTGGAMIVLDGPEITMTAQRDIRIQAGGTVMIHGGPQVHINPPAVARLGESGLAKPPPDKVVWFQLKGDDGGPLAGVRCYVEMGDGTASAPQVTDGQGAVRFAVDGDGPYEIKLGRPPAAEEGA